MGKQEKDDNFDARVKKIIPGRFYMISSSADSQESEEAYNAGEFELPNPAGKAGGACTSAFLQAMYENGEKQSWIDLLREMREALKGMGFDQIPQLTSSRLLNAEKRISIVPEGSGRRRALLIGVRYVLEEKGQLKATWNDVLNLREFLEEVYGFDEKEMLILMDDGIHQPPTKANIERGFRLLTKYSQPGDVVFVSFSGHGGRIEDRDGDEDDGFDETIIPGDFKTAGQIIDDELLAYFVKPTQKGVNVTIIMDCCHSGTVMDLPYTMGADDEKMHREQGFNMAQVDPDGVTAGVEAKKPKDPEKEKKKKEKKEKKDKKKEKKSKKDKKDKDKSNEGGDEQEEEEDEKDKDEEDDETLLGPKISETGEPELPVRPASKKSDLPPPPPPPKQGCTIM